MFGRQVLRGLFVGGALGKIRIDNYKHILVVSLAYLIDSVDIQRLELGLGLGLWYLVLVRGHSVPPDTSILQPPPQNEPARA